MREEAKWWILDAERSFLTAENNFKLKFYEVAVFYCQQCLEKLLKGSTIHFLKRLPKKTHRLMTLYKPLRKHVQLDKDLEDFLVQITPYYFITRYPDTAMGPPYEVITKSFAEDCISKTRRILSCFLKNISKE